MIVGEVVEIDTAFKDGQTDDEGNALALGTIQVRIGGASSNLGQVRNVYARPAQFQRRIPLIGEQVYMMLAPINSETTDGTIGMGYIYFNPINATDDLVLHQLPSVFTRNQEKQGKNKAKRKHDKGEVGYTFPKRPKKTENIQPFEGDDIMEGRFGQSIRFGSTVQGNMSNYAEKPTWKGGSNTDPLMILRLKKPSGNTKQNTGNVGSDFSSNAKYTIEDLGKDEASIYMATTQMLTEFKAGFKKNTDVKTATNWSGNSQIITSAERVIMNATDDKAFVIGNKEVVITGKKILLQDENYKVYLSDLMDFLKSWLKQDKDLAQGTKMYATSCGPTSVATNLGEYIKLSTVDWQTFKLP